MRMVFRYLRPHYAAMGGGFVIKLFGTVAELMLPYILSYMLADVITQEVSDMLFWGAVMLVCAILSCVLNVIANRMAARVSQQFAQAMRRDLFDKTLRLSATQTDRFTVPSLESRITSDTYNVHHFVNMAQRLGVRAPIMLLGGIVITLCMDVRLSLVMIALLPLIFVVVYAISRKGVPLYGKVQRAVDGMVRVVREGASGIRVIKALSKTTYEHRRYDEVNNTLVHDETKAGVIMGSVNPIMTLFMNIGSVAVVALGARYVSKDVSSPETVIAFMQYFTLISMAMMSVTRIFVMYTKCAASAGRIAEVMEAPEDITVADKQQYPDKASDAHIRFEDVSFSYSGKTEQLRHIDFAVDKGGRLGLIGATGAGKSTVIKLLLRFYDVSDGAIYIDGEDIRTIPKERLYGLFGSVQQHDFLYADTIAENIRFGRELSDEAIRRAAVIAQADGFISALDDGYDYLLTAHGTNLSGGQKQRLLIARALAGEPSILILDDSSSALDYKTDAALRQALAKSLSHTTVVTVAQRVSAVKDHDWILVLDEGRVIGSGTHDELLRSCETYREISESQMGGAFVE